MQVQLPLALPKNPNNLKEAMSSNEADKWKEAIDNEMSQFQLRNTFAPAEQHGRGMKTKLILKYAYNNDYSIKTKARLVVCGYSQIKGVDYYDTYAPTTNIVVVFILLSIATMGRYEMSTFDVSAAFLEGVNDVIQYAWIPAELCANNTATRVKVIGNWYGEKQEPKLWYEKFDNIMILMKFIRCPVLPCLYYYENKEDNIIMMITVHVDDGILISNSCKANDLFMKEFLKHVIKAKLSELFKRYLGMDFQKTDNSIIVTQSKYIEDINDYNNNEINNNSNNNNSNNNETDDNSYKWKKCNTPMLNTVNLRKSEPNVNNDSLLPITGKLRFIADRCRPDILVATGEISCGGDKNPSDNHIKTAERTVKYLRMTKDLGVAFN